MIALLHLLHRANSIVLHNCRPAWAKRSLVAAPDRGGDDVSSHVRRLCPAKPRLDVDYPQRDVRSGAEDGLSQSEQILPDIILCWWKKVTAHLGDRESRQPAALSALRAAHREAAELAGEKSAFAVSDDGPCLNG
jgi:hypothetical protein